MYIDAQTAVLVCSGPSIDLLSPVAWAEIQKAGAVISINTALAARACLLNRVRFTYAAALDAQKEASLDHKIPGFSRLWETTPAWRLRTTGWRLSTHGPDGLQAESYIVKALGGWSDDPNEGYAGGSKGMVVGNWVAKDWPSDPETREQLAAISRRTGKPIPRRGFKNLAYVGLDMNRHQGAHASGAGAHLSGFSQDPERDQRVRRAWGNFCQAAAERAINAVNLSPGTCLEAMPRIEIPAAWLLS